MGGVRSGLAALLVAFAGATAPAHAGEISVTAAQLQRAVAEFCIPALNGSDADAVAQSTGAIQPDGLAPAQREWVAQSRRATYYAFPLRKGTLLFQASRAERAAVCTVALFDAAPREVDQAYTVLDGYFTAKGFEKIQGRAPAGARAAGYKGDNGSLLVVLGNQERGAVKAGVQMHIMMKRRLDAF